jgi:hypothetical protein
MKKFSLIICLALVFINCLSAQPTEQMVKVVVAPDHADWLYKTGENVKFSISVLQYGNPVKNAVIRYSIAPEKMEAIKKDSLVLPNGVLSVDGGTMSTPGFLRCTVTAFIDGKEYTKLATAGFDPLTIKPTVDNPSDFTQFWNKGTNDFNTRTLHRKSKCLSC